MSDLEQINQVLLEELEKRDEEISKLQTDINSLLDAPDSAPGGSSSLSEKEISKLVKKNRNLVVKLNKAKGQIVQLEMNLKQEKEKLQEQKKQGSNRKGFVSRHYGGSAPGKTKKAPGDSTAAGEEESIQEELGSLQQKLHEQTKKYEKSVLRINELRESNQKLRLEAKKMKNLLQKELGENVDIDQLLLNSDQQEGWRGRQQEIFLLKSKVKQLQNQVVLLKRKQQEAGTPNDEENASEMDEVPSPSPSSTVDPKQMQTIRQLSDARRQEISDLQEQLKKAESSRQKWKRNTEAAKARCNILEREISSHNMKMSRIIKKTENDDKYIRALKSELDKLRGKLRESNKKLSDTRTIKPGETLSSTLTTLHNQEVDELQRQVADMEGELSQKEETIQSLKQQLRHATEEGVAVSPVGVSSISNPKNSAELRVTILELELEKSRDLEQLHRQQLKDYELRQLDYTDEIQSLKHRIKDLEHSLGSSSIKQSGSMKSPSGGSAGTPEETDPERLADNLYLVMDENNVLKQTIKSLRSAKERELKIYKDLLLKQKHQIDTFAKQRGMTANASSSRENSAAAASPSDAEQKVEQLTKQLKEMKNRYTAVSIQLQNAQNRLKQLQ